MKQNQVRRYRHERMDYAKWTKMRRGEGRKFVKVSFKPEKKRTGKWTLRERKKRPDEWIEGTQKRAKRTAEKGKRELTF